MCGFGLKTVPAAFSARLHDDRSPVLQIGVDKWLDDLFLHRKTLAEHLDLIREVLRLRLLRKVLCALLQVQVVLPGAGIFGSNGWTGRRSTSTVQDSGAKASAQPTTVGEVRAFLGS